MSVVFCDPFSSLPLRPQPRNSGDFIFYFILFFSNQDSGIKCDFQIMIILSYDNFKHNTAAPFILNLFFVSSRGDQKVNLNVLCRRQPWHVAQREKVSDVAFQFRISNLQEN